MPVNVSLYVKKKSQRTRLLEVFRVILWKNIKVLYFNIFILEKYKNVIFFQFLQRKQATLDTMKSSDCTEEDHLSGISFIIAS